MPVVIPCSFFAGLTRRSSDLLAYRACAEVKR